MADSHDLVIRSLDEEMVHFDTVVDSTVHTKDLVAASTTKVFENIDLNDVRLSDPKSVDAYAKLAAIALKAQESKEATAKSRIAAKLKLNDSRRSDGASEIVAQMFKQMQDGTYSPPTDEQTTITQDEKAVAERFAHDNLPPIEEWETRMSAEDLSE